MLPYSVELLTIGTCLKSYVNAGEKVQDRQYMYKCMCDHWPSLIKEKDTLVLSESKKSMMNVGIAK